MSDTEFDAIVIGGGSGGYAAARTLHAGGKKVAVVEGGNEVGGLCILRGCMPTKALLFAAEVKHLADHGATWGLDIPNVGFDFKKVMARKNAMIDDFASYRREQLEDGRFAFFRSMARFEDAHHIRLEDGTLLKADQFIIATGSRITPSPIPALDEVGYLTSDTALTMDALPKSIAVLGGGAIACEFAQFFSRFGVKVHLIQRSARILKEFDEDASSVVETVFRNEGMEVYTGTQLTDARKEGDEKVLSFKQGDQDQEVRVEEIFYALGRSPNTGSLDLEKAGVNTNKRGYVVTDNSMRSTAENIYAAGDCAGPYEIVHIAIQQGELAAGNILSGESNQMDYSLLSSIVFTDPQVACVGLTEQTAKEQGIDFITEDYPFNDHGKSMIMDAMHGFVKLLACPTTGKILGGACVGPVGGELIHQIIIAMGAGMTVHKLASIPHYHPTLAEIWTYPADDLAERIEG